MQFIQVCVIREYEPLFFSEISHATVFGVAYHPATEVVFNLTIYPIKTSIWQEFFNCPEWDRWRNSVFIKRVSMVELLNRG